MKDIEIKYQTCNLCDALHRNINDNFESVSFDILSNGDIRTKFILYELREQEKEYIDDLTTEFEAKQERDCILKPIIEVATNNNMPLRYIVYQKNNKNS